MEPAPLQAAWERWRRLPGGRALFSRGLGWRIPYTATISPSILELRPGYAKLRMKDRRRVRNHLRSIHAIALVNLAEVTGGLALHARLPADRRGIVLGLSIEYLKKARGTLVAECRCDELVLAPEEREYQVESFLRDQDGDVVAKATARWLIGPRP